MRPRRDDSDYIYFNVTGIPAGWTILFEPYLGRSVLYLSITGSTTALAARGSWYTRSVAFT